MDIKDIHISGSEVAALLGLSKWETPMGIYMRKLGMTEPQPENEPMRWGSAAEHVVARRYAKQMGVNLYPSIDQGYDRHNPLIHPEYPWWAGTPDRKIHGPNNENWGLLEIKIIGERSAGYFGEPPDGEIPDEYACQMAWYFPLINAEWGDLAVQVGNREFRIYRIHRDRELEETMRDAALDFINNHLIPEIPPAIDGSDRSSEYLRRQFPQEEKPLIETADESILADIVRYRERRVAAKNLEAEIAFYENKLKEYIGNHAGIKGDFGKISWTKNKDTYKTDWMGLAQALMPLLSQERQAAIMDEFTTFKPGPRVFRAKLTLED